MPEPHPDDRSRSRTGLIVATVLTVVATLAVAAGAWAHRHTPQPTIAHSWACFYTWVANSNLSALLMSLAVPVIPLAVIAEYHHHRTITRLRAHRDLLTAHHDRLTAIEANTTPPAQP